MEIVNHLMGKVKEGTVVLNVQSELVDEEPLERTAAGQVLRTEISVTREELKPQLREAKNAFEQALQKRDISTARALEEARNDLERERRNLASNRDELNKTLVEMYRKEEERLITRINEKEAQ